MTYATTTERLLDRYNSNLRRPTVERNSVRETIFHSFRRTLGPWLPAEKSARILDIGCGEGALLSFLREAGYRNLDGFDISPENVGICHQLGLTWVRHFDALRLDQYGGRGRYDVIFALDIIEHLPKQWVAGFAETIAKMLAPGGWVVIQAPNMGSLYGCLYRYYDLTHEFGLTERTAIDLLSLAGFSLSEIEVRPAWNATTPLGRLRELYLRLIHFLVFVGDGRTRPKVPTRNLLIRGRLQP